MVEKLYTKNQDKKNDILQFFHVLLIYTFAYNILFSVILSNVS